MAIYSQTGCSFPGNFANYRRNIGILFDNLLEPICNRREQLARFSCEVVSFESCVASFLGNSFLNWNFDLEYYPAGEIRVLSCERQREANLFKATTTNFTCDIKQNRKFKPKHVVYKTRHY